MIDGFKNREVVCMPMVYTCDVISGDMRREYLETGAITLPYIEPPERTRDDFMSRDWDAKDAFRGDSEDELLDYLNWLDENEEDF